jgi:virginiamycin B lyase
VGADGTLWLSNGYSILHLSQTGAVLGSYNYAAQYIMTGTDGNIWFTQSDAIGTLNVTTGMITLYPIYESVPNCQPGYGCSRGISTMTAGPDGAYWFVEKNTGYIGRIDTATGNFSEYQIYAAHVKPFDITAGPDGNVWFVDAGAQKIGKVNLSAL